MIQTSEFIHASAAAFNHQAVMMIGDSGSGKTRTLWRFLRLGFTMIGDDQISMHNDGDDIVLAPNPNAENRLEFRHLGIFAAKEVTTAPLKLVLDFNQSEAERLPHSQFVNLLGKNIRKINAQGLDGIEDAVYLWFSQKLNLLEID